MEHSIKWNEKKFNEIKNLKLDIQFIAWLYQNDMTIDDLQIKELKTSIDNVISKLMIVSRELNNI